MARQQGHTRLTAYGQIDGDKKMKEYVLLADGYTNLLNIEKATQFKFNPKEKSLQQHIAEFAAEMGLDEWEEVTLTPMSKVPQGAVAKVVTNWFYEITYIIAPKKDEKSEEKEQVKQEEPACAYEGMTEAERSKKEREYDNLYNEGGEGYNPYRLPEIYPIIEPQDY